MQINCTTCRATFWSCHAGSLQTARPAPTCVKRQDVAHAPSEMGPSDLEAVSRFSRHYDAAELYAAYSVVHERAVRPFRTADDATLFGAARWVGSGVARLPRRACTTRASTPTWMCLRASHARAPRDSVRFVVSRLLLREAPPPPGVSLSTALLALAKAAVDLGAFKLARFAYGKLQVGQTALNQKCQQGPAG